MMSRPLVLVVDDNPTMQNVLTMTFKMEGMNTLVAERGEYAWGLLHRDKPDLVILDVNLKGKISGIHILRAMRKDPDLKNIPVVLLTAEHVAADSPEAQAADLVMLKPADPEQLIMLAQRLMMRNRAQQ
jgi:two-component system, OmpR family, phosphate regulon response regulator PhoB